MGSGMDLDTLVEHWTLLDDELDLVMTKHGATKLGFALLLKFFTHWGRFPASRSELSDEVVAFVARQVRTDVSDLDRYEWDGRTIERHRGQIRDLLGFRECGVADADKLTAWLAEQVALVERRPEQVRERLLEHCRQARIEPPTPARVERIVASALHQAEETLFARVAGRLPDEIVSRLNALIAPDADDEDGPEEGHSLLARIKADPGNVSLDSLLTEIDKLLAVRAVDLPAGVFSDVAPKVLDGWRAQAAVEFPSHLRAHPNPAKTLTLLAALLHTRESEITDTLVELLVATVHRINARAERRVTKELVNAFRRVTGKENILFSIAEASLAAPDCPVRQVVYPAVAGGEQTLRELVHEYRTRGPVYRRTVQMTLRSSYTNHYRRGLVRLLEVLEFRSTNTRQPVIEALSLVRRYSAAGNLSYYPLGEHVPLHHGLGGDWEALVHRADKRGRCRVVRMVYEICTFRALRDGLRCKEIWVVGTKRWRNPDEDLPADFEEQRVGHYRALRKPLDPREFIDPLRQEMQAGLAALNEALPGLSWLEIAERPSGAIKLTPLDALPEPVNLRRLKAEVLGHWGTVALIDMLKEAVLRTGCLRGINARADHRCSSFRPQHPESQSAVSLTRRETGFGGW